MERTISGEGGTSATGPVKLDHWQTLLLGGLSGGMGPLANNPLGEPDEHYVLNICPPLDPVTHAQKTTCRCRQDTHAKASHSSGERTKGTQMCALLNAF